MRHVRTPRRRTTWAAGLLSAALLLTACGGGEDDGDGDAAGEEETDGEDGEGSEDGGGNVGEGEEISIGWMPWEEAIAVTNLWDVILSENGFEVEQTQLDPGLVYEGMSTGDVDLFLDAWLPATHEEYWNQYSDQLEDYGAWLDDAPLTWTVPAYVEEVDSFEDLEGNADLFDGEVIGIEPGAGLTAASEEAIEVYDLGDEYELITSSTPAMLSELDTAIQNEEPVLVTLWRPHPSYAQYDLKDLEDPENALGDPDEIRAVSRDGFSDDYPEVATALENFQFEHEALSELEVAVLEDVEDGNELEGAQNWLDENRDLVNEWLEGTDLEV